MSIVFRSPQSRMSFISSLNLAAPPSEDGTQVVGESAWVIAGSTISFMSGVPLLQQDDVLNSTLLAQLAADAQFDREKEREMWYAAYRTVLENVGWIIDGFRFSHFISSSAEIRLDCVSAAVLRPIMSGAELEILEKTLNSLEENPRNNDALQLFNDQASKSDAGNYQLGTASLDSDKNAVLSHGAFYFRATEHEDCFLFAVWESENINCFYSVQHAVLNDQIYSTVRRAVIDKLGDDARVFIKPIDLTSQTLGLRRG